MDDKNLKLYKLTCGGQLGNFYVIAEDPTTAMNKLVDALNKAERGFSSERMVKYIEFMANLVVEDHTGKLKLYDDYKLVM